MKRVIYLNYDMDNPKERACYNALVELGQSKKSFINLLLSRSGLVDLTNTEMILQPKKRKKRKEKDVEENKTEQSVTYEEHVQDSDQNPLQQAPVQQQQIQQQSVMQQPVTTQQEPTNDISDEEAAMLSQLGNIFQSMQS